ncbi:MAG: hypothetical protein WCX88_01850 [Patescibacteria group bacterium]
MAITLRADNRSLLNNAKYSYILDNISSGAATITVANSDAFAALDYIVIGNMGSENTELVQVDSLVTSTGVITLVTATRFAHSESSRVTSVGYNQVVFYWTALQTVPNPSTAQISSTIQNNNITSTKVQASTAPKTTTYTRASDPTIVETLDVTPPITYDSDNWLATNAIQVDNFFTTYADTNQAHTSGYGWFLFYNSTTTAVSPLSNAIPYGGFNPNTVKAVFSDFDSCLNQKEIKLISMDDKYSWLNEAYSLMINELNLGNWEYNASEPLALAIKSGVTDYLLPDDFANMLYINEENGDKIEHFSATFRIPRSTSFREYAVRGRHLVIRPTPEADSTITLEYLKNSSRLTDMQAVINLPDNAAYSIKDFMLFRAYRKLGNLTESNNSLTLFNKNVDRMKIYSCKRDNGLDSFSIGTEQNV